MKGLFSLIVLMQIISCESSKSQSQTTVLPAKTTTLSEKEILEKGKLLFEKSCSKCHSLPNTKDYNLTQWQPILQRELSRTNLSGDDKNWLAIYVYSNTK